ncbi:MAG: PQQ-dependent sugar dehydrogenase [Candidatus Buchananbacteria bacterium]|nr:PQQ-dependent sugar dehydrogenase [Candidatus Buchananbacteria bacterium]
MKKGVLISLFIIIFLVTAFLFRTKITRLFFSPSAPQGELGINVFNLAANRTPDTNQTPNAKPGADQAVTDIEIIAKNLLIPWEIGFLPTGEMLVTERAGNLLKIGANKTVIKIQGVEHVGEGGLQGMALHPDFKNNNFIYLYLTTRTKDGLINRVERYRLTGDTLTDKKIIIDNIPGAQYHDGGRIEFGPDSKLYVTTGDATKSDKAQDPNFLGGKILRLNDDGSIPSDNPNPTSLIYSLGHRNPQGLAWDESGQLWATEHGRSGALSGLDELNIIEPNQNYGWPTIQGDQTKPGLTTPVVHSGSDVTWAPGDAIYLNGSIFFTGLRGEAIYQYQIETKKFFTHFYRDFGRLRAIVIGPDGFIYVSTSNTDGRGESKTEDDKIIAINPEIFN